MCVCLRVCVQVVSGLRILALQCMRSHRHRVVMAAGLSCGLGVALMPAWAAGRLGVELGRDAVSPVMVEAVVLLVSTPYVIGVCVCARAGERVSM